MLMKLLFILQFFSVSLQGDDIQDFDTRCDQGLLYASEITEDT